ncbi:DUF5357 family protein [Planktothrix sp. FACHB-1355]|uniref:DUF5357 family protein n=1 Tax=Aerosakkonema funiforme FACHB-1375 TaxID=2949571 RepID=A0A926VF37_9CYAN|nr:MULTISPECIES: DUF5357 family protein [Oscillatoriales]MBD2182088.1 DUF5357 family protein [Aerosakkonema funiforme FACHB-1375]MBD3559809.1 DUF5357 family protein [Planktothrix sp. FACHB-1355]
MKEISKWVSIFVKLIKPPQIFSWQTGFIISLLIWSIAVFTIASLQNILALVSWLFLLISSVLFAIEKPLIIGGIALSPWISGALMSIFLFSISSNRIQDFALVIWPILSGIIAVMAELMHPGGKFKIPSPASGQRLVILFLIHVLISCWLQFNFFIQDWLQRYPSLLVDNFSQSTFVIKIAYLSNTTSRGASVLDAIDSQIKTQIDNQPWPQAERWLIDADKRVAILADEVMKKLLPAEENSMWSFETKFLPSQIGYNLQLLGKWQGLGSMPEGYHIKKTCRISPVTIEGSYLPSTRENILRLRRSRSAVNRTTPAVSIAVSSPVTLTRVICGPVTSPIKGQPKSSKS